MPDRPTAHDFVYVHTDIPEGMTIREWRVERAAERLAAAAAERDARRERRTRAIRRWRAAMHVAVHRPRLRRREARA